MGLLRMAPSNHQFEKTALEGTFLWQSPLVAHLFMPFLKLGPPFWPYLGGLGRIFLGFNEVCKRGVGLHTSFGMTNLLL